MPYLADKNIIHTKVLGVTLANQSGNRQSILREIKEGLIKPKFFYLEGSNVHVIIESPNGNTDTYIGNIKSEYTSITSKSKYLISSYQITGGHKLQDVASKARAFLGINITIKLFPEKIEKVLEII